MPRFRSFRSQLTFRIAKDKRIANERQDKLHAVILDDIEGARQMRLLWIVSLLAAASFPAVAGGCPVEGLRIRWQADYCMFKVGSDDIITADPCIRADSKRHYRNDCEAKKYYKLQICRMTGSGLKQSPAQCFKDKSAVGPTVRNGGVGG